MAPGTNSRSRSSADVSKFFGLGVVWQCVCGESSTVVVCVCVRARGYMVPYVCMLFGVCLYAKRMGEIALLRLNVFVCDACCMGKMGDGMPR